MDAETRTPPYQYRPVRPGWIRILHLLSQPGEPLRCRIETMELGHRESTDFIALSYVWGESSEVDTIGVVGDDGTGDNSTVPLVGQLTLTTSLHHTLQDLAGCDEIQPKTFWIDQICINQHDEDEKSHQVLQMSNVYQSARRVVTHIGVGQEGDDEAIALLGRIYDFYEPFAHIVDSWWVGATSPQVYHHYFLAEIPTELRFPEDLSHGDGLELFNHAERILGGPWSTRYWMVQENVLNPDTVCLRGRHTISMNLVNRIGGLNWLGLLSRVGDTRTNHLQPLFTTRAQWRHNEATIQGLHLSHRTRVCADPKDKIYAILGLANDATRLGIVPDYHKPVAQVFTDLWVAYTRLRLVESDISKSLGFLEGTSCGSSGSGMDSYDSTPIPTWVPTYEGEGYWIPNESDADATQTDSNIRARTLAAQVEFESTSAVNNGKLLVKGLEVGPDSSSALDVYLGTYPLISLVEPYDATRIPDTVALLERTMESFGDTDSALAMVYEALLGGAKLPASETGARPTDADLAQALREVRGLLRRQAYSHVPHVPGGKVTRAAFHLYENSLALHSRSLWVSKDRRLCVAPNQAQKGDLPVILFGGRWIYYLRSRGGLGAGLVGDVHEYVGWGSVPGCMRGELLEEAGWEDRVKTFTLI